MPRPLQPSATLDISASAPSPQHRLPVNPRRKKVAPDERKRVATACNSCNVRRIKCSGERPCRQCTSAQRECMYPEPIERVTVPRAELESLQRRCASLERQLAATERDDGRPGAQQQQHQQHQQQHQQQQHQQQQQQQQHQQQQQQQHVGSATVPSHPNATDPHSLAGDTQHAMRSGGIDGRMLADSDGTSRYLGETSGATFLDALKELIATAAPLVRVLHAQSGETPAGVAFLESLGRYQTNDSRPMVLPEGADPLALPPEADIAYALSQVRYFILDGNGAFASGGTMFWPFEDLQSILALASLPAVQRPGGPRLPGPNHRSLALYHMAFAITRSLNLREPGSAVNGQLGEEHFARARSLLGNPLDRTTYTITDIAVLALMALYLIENNRRDAAYMAISNAMAISVMHGIHRGVSSSEVGVRTFWTVYVLDRWLGCVMGRPPSTPDDAITLPLPRDCPGLPSPVGLRAHVELCKISDYIVYSSYRESGLPHLLSKATVRVNKALDMLQKWHANLPSSLRLPDPLSLLPADLFTQASAFGRDPTALLSGAAEFGRDRACWALHMSYYQLVILSVRPAMLMAVRKAVASIVYIDQPFDIESHPSIETIRAISDAARCNLRLGRLMRLHSPRKKLMLPDLHNIFNAAIVLTMHQIVFVNLRTQDLDDVGWAIEVFESEAETGSEYGKDCTRVLKDFKYLAHQLRNPIHVPETKRILLSDEGFLHDSLWDNLVAGEIMAYDGNDGPDDSNGQDQSPGRRGTHGTLYQSWEALYQTLSCWWNADYTQFYNTFLS